MGQKLIISFLMGICVICIQEPPHHFLQTFRPLRRLCSAIVHFIRNNVFILSPKADQRKRWPHWRHCLPISVAWTNCRTSSKTAVANIEAFTHLILCQQGKRKHNKNESFLAHFMRILNSCVA